MLSHRVHGQQSTSLCAQDLTCKPLRRHSCTSDCLGMTCARVRGAMCASLSYEMPLVTCGTVLQNEVMPRAMRALKRALQVKSPVVNNLTLPRTCHVTFTSTGACSQYYPLDQVCQGALPETPPAELFRGEECASDLPVFLETIK